METASGGRAWSAVGQITALGTIRMAGLTGTGRLDDDVVTGRFAQHANVAGMGATAEIYDGETLWSQDISGGVHPYDTPFARSRAITDAYLARHGYADPRAGDRLICIGTRMEDGRMVTVVRVTPRGGIPAELAIDAQTHLLARVTEQFPLPGDDGVTRYSDYRTVGDLVLPFAIDSGTATDPTDGYALKVSSYRVRADVAREDFHKPVASDDVRMIGGARSSTVPMALEGRQLIVWASIDGHAPMPFILDTGGHAILTTGAAKALGLHGAGAGASGGSGSGTIATQYAPAASVRIGSAELLRQHFLVIDYPYSFYERGKRQPLAGILGLEFFERFAVQLDYGDRRVTFTPLESYVHRGSAGVPLRFEDQEDMPVITAAADGHPGWFGTDTGNAGTLILFGEYLRRTGLLSAYSSGVTTVGQGTGGSNTGHRGTLRRLAIGAHDLRNIETNFTQMTSGSFASRTEAGNMGFSILSRFLPTFDYADQMLYLDPERRATPFGANRSGLHVTKNGPEAFDVLLVDPGSAAAAAGIVKGDRIVAVDGKDAPNYSWADFVAIIGEPAGTTLALRVSHAGTVRDVSLVLR